MDISSFFNTYPGIHIVQAFLHSLTATVIADRSIHAWDIKSPLIRQRFRLIVILVPIFSYPIYQLIDPGRGSISFRLGALLDSNRWLSLELWGKVPVSIFFIALLVSTTALFLVQELIPILRHTAESKQSELEWDHPGEGSPVIGVLKGLPMEMPDIFIAEDANPVVYSTTGNNPAVFLTTGLIDKLEPEELRAAVAHEVAHIRRSRRPLLMFTYLLRVLQFFSPATLVEFRKVVEDEEKICDDSAVEITGKPGALAGALEKLRHGSSDNIKGDNPAEMLRAIERMSHDMLIRNRIRRLSGREAAQAEGSGWMKFAATLAAVLMINYFIV
jgi:Zn-dependent protease with chaperone function